MFEFTENALFFLFYLVCQSIPFVQPATDDAVVRLYFYANYLIYELFINHKISTITLFASNITTLKEAYLWPKGIDDDDFHGMCSSVARYSAQN